MALLFDRLVGDPQWLWRHIPHPVVFFGKLIHFTERAGNHAGFSKQRRFWHGWLAIMFLLSAAAGAGLLLAKICHCQGVAGLLAEVVIVSLFLAQKSLADHVMAVHDALEKGGLEQGRAAVSMIVGRNPHTLDKGGVCRAAIESLAENSSDGVIAPAFWFLVLGLPGLFSYKMLNTADSMTGHKNARYAAFGFAAAWLDDAANYIPARLTGGLVVLAAFFAYGRDEAKRAWQVMLRDAGHHRSPNAGWPESAFAGALDIRLAGPRSYGASKIDEPFQNAGGAESDSADIPRAVQLFWSVMNIVSALVAGVTILFSLYVFSVLFF